MSARSSMRSFSVMALFAVLCPGLAMGQNWDQFGRGLELKAHEMLMEQVAKVASPNPFTTDGCSGGMSSAWQTVAAYWPQFERDHHQQPPFEPCCISHDRAYHGAGSALTATDSYEVRLSADRALQSCVIETGSIRRDELAALYEVSPSQVVEAYGLLADSMYYSVRFGGGPCSGLSWRWGYGYDQCWSGN